MSSYHSKLYRDLNQDKFSILPLTANNNRSPSHIDGINVGKTKKQLEKIKSASKLDDLGAGNYAVLRDPYTWPMKIRFEEAYRTDPVVRSAINRKVSFILGKKIKTVFDVMDSFIHPQESRTALNIIMSDQEMVNAKRAIDRIHRKVKFQHCLKAATIQSKVFGRSALLIDWNQEDLPENIKILNAKLLGQVRIDEDTWELQSLQYNTNNRGLNDPYNFLDADDIIYFTNLNFHVSPYTINYGLSDIEPIAHISEINRVLNEEDLKEVNFSQWAGYGLLYVPNTRNAAEINQFLSTFQPGKWTAISQDIRAEVHELQRDLNSLIEERDRNEKLILRSLNVPSMILGFEDIQNYACLDHTTMTLTENGWKYYWEIKEGEKIATVNPDTHELEYHIPDGFYLYDFDGEMIRFKTENQDFLVTPNHRMWMTHNGKHWSKREAQDLENMSKFAFLGSVLWNEQNEVEITDIPVIEYSKFGAYCNRTTQIQTVKMDDWLSFIGFYISEGGILTKPYRRKDRPDLKNAQYTHTITIAQNTDPIKNGVNVCDVIDSCIQKIPFKFHSYVETNRKHKHWQLQNKQLHIYLRQFGEHAYNKCIPRWILNLGKRQLKIIFDSMMLGDGSFRKSGTIEYCTSSKQLADDVQELALKLGYHAWIKGPYTDKRTDYNRHPMYHVNISPVRQLTWINRQNITREYYKGKVYCFNVKNHLFVVRRNGKVGVTHNTAQEVMLAWRESVLEEERTWLNDTLELQWFDMLLAKILNIDDIDQLKAKVILAFEDIALENMKDKVLAALPIYEAGLISGEKVLEIMGFDDIADQYKMMQQKKDQAEQEFNQQLAEDQQTVGTQAPNLDNPNPEAVKYPATAATSLLQQVEKAKGKQAPQNTAL